MEQTPTGEEKITLSERLRREDAVAARKPLFGDDEHSEQTVPRGTTSSIFTKEPTIPEEETNDDLYDNVPVTAR